MRGIWVTLARVMLGGTLILSAMRIAIAAPGQISTFSMGENGLVVLEQLQAGKFDGRLYTLDALGNRTWTYNVNGSGAGSELDLQFLDVESGSPAFEGQFYLKNLEALQPDEPALVQLGGTGFDATVNALLLQDKLRGLLDEGKKSELLAAGYATYRLGGDADLQTLAAGFGGQDVVRLLRDATGQYLWIKPGFEDLVATQASAQGFQLVTQLPPPTGRHVVLKARRGAIVPEESSVYDRQPMVREALQNAIKYPADVFALTPLTGTEYQLTVRGSYSDFALGTTFSPKFYRLVFRIVVTMELGDEPGQYQDLIRIIFERGELKAQNGATDVRMVSDQGYSNIEETNPDRDEVPARVAAMFAAYFSTAFKAIR